MKKNYEFYTEFFRVNEVFLPRNFDQKYDVNISWNIRNFQKVLSTKSFYFLFNTSLKLKNGEWNIAFERKVQIMKKTLFIQKIPFKIDKISSTKWFSFLYFHIWIWKFWGNRLVRGWDIAKSLFRDMFKVWKHALCSKNMGQIKKKCHKKICFTS